MKQSTLYLVIAACFYFTFAIAYEYSTTSTLTNKLQHVDTRMRQIEHQIKRAASYPYQAKWTKDGVIYHGAANKADLIDSIVSEISKFKPRATCTLDTSEVCVDFEDRHNCYTILKRVK